MVNIEINGKPLQAPQGAMVIEVADQAGITIPRFCYHSKLSIAANCRMCLVEVDKVAKPLPACATPVSEGMKVFTRSPKAISAQRAVLEFLLINHPLDCPICDQGGECDLQEMAIGFGNSDSEYHLEKRVVMNKNLGPLIATDMTRCIHCTRCVRFGEEIAGVMELGATGRGEHTEIGTYVQRSVDSELSGNAIDLCPVGALTSKPFRFSARSWELSNRPGVAPHDCVGSNVLLQTRNGELMRVLPRENDALNEIWLADRDRFSYLGLHHEERLTRPMVKKDGAWSETDWDTALAAAVEGLQKLRHNQGPGEIGALASPSATTEELYLLQKLLRGMGSNNIDYRLAQRDFPEGEGWPLYPSLGQSVADLEQLDAVLLVGSNLRKDQPLLAHRLRKAAKGGAKVAMLNAVAYEQRIPLAVNFTTAPTTLPAELAAIGVALADKVGQSAPAGMQDIAAAVTDDHRAVAELLNNGAKVAVLLGNGVQAHAAYGDLATLGAAIAKLAGGTLGLLTVGGNAAGAALAGCLPHSESAGAAVSPAGKNAGQMIAEPLAAYVLLGVEPELDYADAAAAVKAMTDAQFVVSLSAYASPAMREYADVLLPIALYPETSGTLVNAEGSWQSFAGAVAPMGDARPAWKVLRVLGNLFDLSGFEYVSSEEVLSELGDACAALEANNDIPWTKPAAAVAVSGIQRISDRPIYAVDAMVRRSAPLQDTKDAQVAVVVHPDTAGEVGLADCAEVMVAQGGVSCVLPLTLDARVARGAALIPAGLAETAMLGVGGEAVTLARPESK